MKQTLEEFRKRCPGILGTLVIDSKREVVERELPSFLKVDTPQFTSQLLDIYLALEPIRKLNKTRNFNEHDMILKFDSIVVYCRVFQTGLLVMFAESDANITKLRALSNLLVKKIDSLLQDSEGGK